MGLVLLPAIEGVVYQQPPVRPVRVGYVLPCGAAYAAVALGVVGYQVSGGVDVHGGHAASVDRSYPPVDEGDFPQVGRLGCAVPCRVLPVGWRGPLGSARLCRVVPGLAHPAAEEEPGQAGDGSRAQPPRLGA